MTYGHQQIIHSIEELPNLALTFLETIPAQSIVCLEAEMGMGKTTFTKFVLQAMGIKDVQGSPTYSIVNQYISPLYGKVYHLDLYRIEDEEELLDIGLEEILYSDCFVFIEWASRAKNLLPEKVIYLSIARNKKGDRVFSW